MLLLSSVGSFCVYHRCIDVSNCPVVVSFAVMLLIVRSVYVRSGCLYDGFAKNGYTTGSGRERGRNKSQREASCLIAAARLEVHSYGWRLLLSSCRSHRQ